MNIHNTNLITLENYKGEEIFSAPLSTRIVKLHKRFGGQTSSMTPQEGLKIIMNEYKVIDLKYRFDVDDDVIAEMNFQIKEKLMPPHHKLACGKGWVQLKMKKRDFERLTNLLGFSEPVLGGVYYPANCELVI